VFTRHLTRRVLLAILLVKSYSLSHSSGFLAITLVVFTRHPTRRVPSYSLSSSPPVSSSRSFSSRRIVQLPTVCASESCANNVTKLTNLLTASYSPSYSSSLTRHPTRQVLLAVTRRVDSPSHSSCLLAFLLVTSRPRRRYPHRDRTRRVVMYNFPLSVPLRAVLTMSRSSPIYSPRLTRHPTRQVLLAVTRRVDSLSHSSC